MHVVLIQKIKILPKKRKDRKIPISNYGEGKRIIIVRNGEKSQKTMYEAESSVKQDFCN